MTGGRLKWINCELRFCQEDVSVFGMGTLSADYSSICRSLGRNFWPGYFKCVEKKSPFLTLPNGIDSHRRYLANFVNLQNQWPYSFSLASKVSRLSSRLFTNSRLTGETFSADSLVSRIGDELSKASGAFRCIDTYLLETFRLLDWIFRVLIKVGFQQYFFIIDGWDGILTR